MTNEQLNKILKAKTEWSVHFWLGQIDGAITDLEEVDKVLRSARIKRVIDTLSYVRTAFLEKLK
jgi:hypothetical protein